MLGLVFKYVNLNLCFPSTDLVENLAFVNVFESDLKPDPSETNLFLGFTLSD